MFCSKCGLELKDDQIYCPRCGQKAAQAAQAQTEPKQQTAAPVIDLSGAIKIWESVPVKEWIQRGILVLIALFGILTPVFSVVVMKYWGYIRGLGVSGYSLMFGGAYSVIGTTVTFAVVLTWIVFLAELALLGVAALSLVNLFLKKDILNLNDLEKTFRLSAVLAGGSAIIYLIAGIITTVVACNGIGMFGSNSIYIYTAAFWPLIIQALLIAGYICVGKFINFPEKK